MTPAEIAETVSFFAFCWVTGYGGGYIKRTLQRVGDNI